MENKFVITNMSFEWLETVENSKVRITFDAKFASGNNVYGTVVVSITEFNSANGLNGYITLVKSKIAADFENFA